MDLSQPDLDCIVCGFTGVTLHHVRTQGAGGSDHDSNLMPLCHPHHVECHKIGITTFTEKHSNARFWLKEHGWKVIFGKWLPPLDLPG